MPEDIQGRPVFLYSAKADDRKEERKMTGMSFMELVALAIIFIPLIMLMATIIALTVYFIYMLMKDRFLEMLFLHHRKAH